MSVPEIAFAPANGRGSGSSAFRRFAGNRVAMAALVALLAMASLAALAALAPVVERHDPAAIAPEEAHADPSGEHWLGTDNLGRDTWARTLEGVGISLRVAVGAQAIAVCLGIAIGAAAALGGRFGDALIMRGVDAAYAFPDLLAVILVRAMLIDRDVPIIGSGDPQIPGFPGVALQVTIAIGLVNWVTLSRLVRGQMLALRETGYVLAARATGASGARVVVRHMLPNALGPVVVAATFGIPVAIYVEAVLAIIGFGVQPPTASLGTLVYDGYTYMRVNPWLLGAPVGAIAALTLCFTLIGDGLRQAIDPRGE